MLGSLSFSFLGAQDDALVDRLPRSGEWVFRWLPKPFQRDPTLDVTVMTDVFTAGNLDPPASPDHPIYVQLYAAGAKVLGEPYHEKLPEPPLVERALTDALAHNGYLPAGPGQQPKLLIVFYWGTHNAMDRELASMFPEVDLRERMERARLIGGADQIRHMRTIAEWGESILDHNQKYEYLRDQALGDLYFVVASAYDYQGISAGRRTLMWRTKMTVSGRGVSAVETVRPILAAAAPFFGRQMPEPAVAMPRLRRWEVIVGKPVVIETDITPPPLPSAGVPTKP